MTRIISPEAESGEAFDRALRQRRLAQPRRPEQQDVIQRLSPPARGVDEDLQIALGLRLTDELGQAWPRRATSPPS